MWKWQGRIEYVFDMAQRRILLEYRRRTKPELVTIEGIKLAIAPDISTGPREALYGGYYEKSELKIVKRHLKPSDRVMEIGAGLGLISTYCAQKIGSDRVFTYEANPALEPFIRHTYEINNVNPSLQICLVGNQPGEETFYIGKAFWSSSTIQRNSTDQPIQIPVKPFNEEVHKINPTFLIVDIEGGEYELLKDADFHNIKNIAIEIHEVVIGKEKVEFVKAKFAEAGFQLNERFSSKGELFLQRSL